MRNKKLRHRDFTILTFKDKHSRRILEKKSIYGYESNGLWLNYDYLVTNPFWSIQRVQMGDQVLRVGMKMDKMFIKGFSVISENGKEELIIEKSETPVVNPSPYRIISFADYGRGIVYDIHVTDAHPEGRFKSRNHLGTQGLTLDECLASQSMAIYMVKRLSDGNTFKRDNNYWYSVDGQTAQRVRIYKFTIENDRICIYTSANDDGIPDREPYCFLEELLTTPQVELAQLRLI